jgi:hypothetical protein
MAIKRPKVLKGFILVSILLSVVVSASSGYYYSLNSSQESRVVYADTLSDLKAKKKALEKKLKEAEKKVEKEEKSLKKRKHDWIPFNEDDSALKKAKKKRDTIKNELSDVEEDIKALEKKSSSSNPNEAQAKSSTGSSGSTSGDGSSGGSKAKANASYTGGLDQNVNSSDVERNYVKDARRSETDAIRFISDDKATSSLMSSITTSVNSSVGGKYLLVYSTDGMLSFSNNIYRQLTEEDRYKVMDLALRTVKESQLPEKVKYKVSDFIKDQDTKIASSIEALSSDTSWELSKGYTLFVPFTSPLSTFLGFIAIVIFVMLSSSIVFDIAYLTIGFFRSLFENGEGKPRFVTGEAWETAKQVDSSLESGNYKDYILVYAQKRAGIFFFTSLVLIYLISGQIYQVFAWLLTVFEEIFLRGN